MTVKLFFGIHLSLFTVFSGTVTHLTYLGILHFQNVSSHWKYEKHFMLNFWSQSYKEIKYIKKIFYLFNSKYISTKENTECWHENIVYPHQYMYAYFVLDIFKVQRAQWKSLSSWNCRQQNLHMPGLGRPGERKHCNLK